MKTNVTLRDLVSAVSEFAENDDEVIATVVHMVESGQVQLSAGTAVGATAATSVSFGSTASTGCRAAALIVAQLKLRESIAIHAPSRDYRSR